MHIIINNSSMIPIYEQIMDQIKSDILNGHLTPDTMLPSVRGLAKELKISVLTVKKAYDHLEEEGFTVTVHGKGTFVAQTNLDRMQEEVRKNLESALETALTHAQKKGLSRQEVQDIFNLLMEDLYAES